MTEVIVIGCGPAGVTAGLYAARAGLKTLVLGSKKDSQMMYAKNIQNYPGFDCIAGEKLLQVFIDQAKEFGAGFEEKEVVDIQKGFVVKTADNTRYECKAVVIATGLPIPWSGIDGEKDLMGKGVHTCPSCDGPFYKDKRIAVIGNGNHAAEDAVLLSSYSDDLTILSNGKKFSFSDHMKELIEKNKIKMKDAKCESFRKDEDIEVSYKDGSDHFDGVFLACGTAGSTAFAERLGIIMDENLIVVDKNNMTNIAGVFAAGNCMSGCKQIAKNVGDGCNAGVNLIKHVKGTQAYVDYGK